MKLTDLNPHWTCDAIGRHGMGISFDCPVHREHRLAVAFANPVDGGAKMGGSNYWWVRSGETFETLTLQPSVDASGCEQIGNGMIQTPCWHGHIVNGVVT
jgi:hypothetical protein